jgi:hypothetical protein
LQGKSGSSFRELLDLLTVCQDLIRPLLAHEHIKMEMEALSKNPFVETSLSTLQPIFEAFEKCRGILLERAWVFLESGFSLTGRSLHDKTELKAACSTAAALEQTFACIVYVVIGSDFNLAKKSCHDIRRCSYGNSTLNMALS